MKWNTDGSRIMLRGKPLGQERELKTQRQGFSKSRKIWSMLKSRDWQTESPKSLLRRWWLVSETVWVILQVPTMGRMGKMSVMTRQSRASWTEMTNQAGWWAQSAKWYRGAQRGFGRSRWSLTKWQNRDGRMQLTTPGKEGRSTAHLNWGLRLSFNPKWIMTLQHLHRQHMESLWNVWRLSREYRKRHNGLLEQDVVSSG